MLRKWARLSDFPVQDGGNGEKAGKTGRIMKALCEPDLGVDFLMVPQASGRNWNSYSYSYSDSDWD